MEFERNTRRKWIGTGLGTLIATAFLRARNRGGQETAADKWKCVYRLDTKRNVVSGSAKELNRAIRRGADLRIQTEFRHNEHVDMTSDSPELVREVAEFAVTHLIDNRWSAGIMSLRQPISLPDGFGPRPSMSFFLYNQDGGQAIARPYLDGEPATGKRGPSEINDRGAMPKYHQHDSWDKDTNAPSHNFIYDFDCYNFWVRDDWEEVLSHTARGEVVSGSVEALGHEFSMGRDVKISVGGLCADLTDPAGTVQHETFVKTGSCYYYTEQKWFIAGSHPVVRVAPAIPVRYSSGNWDFGWLMARTDGFVARLLVDPYTLEFRRSEHHYPVRWFVR